MNKKAKITLIAIPAVFLLMQAIRPDFTNPPVDQGLDFITTEKPPEKIAVMLKNSCYDCHSHETKPQWYMNVAPVSWLVHHDIDEGRRELNFSEWNKYDNKRKDRKLDEAVELVEADEMPLWFYKPLHPEANLTAEQKKELTGWLTELRNNIGS